MKKNYFFLFFLAQNWLFAQTPVQLHMHQKMGNQPFALQSTINAELGYPFRFTRMEYYLGKIDLIHDGGKVITIDQYFLIKAQHDSIFDLGVQDINQLESIVFHIGVDSKKNHLDPTAYPLGHPLALQEPSMHWGWQAGYRFIAAEGVTSNDGGTSFTDVFEVHTLDDANYKTVSLNLQGVKKNNQLEIHIDADYQKVLNWLDVTGGYFSHSGTGASSTIAINMQQVVFSPTSLISGTPEPGVIGSFTLSPNPAIGIPELNFTFPDMDQVTCKIFSSAGQLIQTKELQSTYQGKLPVSNLSPGLYTVQFRNKKQLLAETKFVIQ